MPLLYTTVKKIKKILNNPQSSLTPIQRIQASFKLLVKMYINQIFSLKKDRALLKEYETSLQMDDSILQIISRLNLLKMKLNINGFASKALNPILEYAVSLPQEKKPELDYKFEIKTQKRTSCSEEKSALRIQSIFRGYSARKKFNIKNISDAKRTNFKAFFVGNDPMIQGLDRYRQRNPFKPIAIIGTSVLRSVEIALTLKNKPVHGDEKNTNIPKLIIIDNSKKVINLWLNLRDFAIQFPDTKEFLTKLPEFLSKNLALYRDIGPESLCTLPNMYIYPNQNILVYFENLFNTHGSIVLKLIASTTIIAQKWEDKSTFEKLKNVLNYLGIEETYVYPSNIVSSLSEETKKSKEVKDQILENIFKLNPKLSIHTDLCPDDHIPKKFFFICPESPPPLPPKLKTSFSF